ncbi:MAG: hypothetical protein RLZZ373_3167 [Pseudomonadota bacterium]
MLVYPPGSSEPLRGDVVVRTIHRSDLIPIPSTIEVVVRDVAETAAFVEGAKFKAGLMKQEFLIVKVGYGAQSGIVQGSRTGDTKAFIGLLASCASLAVPRQRAVVAYESDLLGVMRACGASASITGSVHVGAFACLIGQTPTFSIAQALREAGAALVVGDTGLLEFKRLQDLQRSKPARQMLQDSAEIFESSLVEKSAVPWAFTVAPDGALLHGRRESGRVASYMPWKSPTVLANASMAVITRRILSSIYAPDLRAGQVITMDGDPMLIVTAAHTMAIGGGGPEQESTTRLWLGKVVQ